MLLRPLPELEQLGKFVGGVDVENRERHAAEKRFPRQPDQHVRILSHRPGHGDVLERVIRLAKNKNALVLEVVEMTALISLHVDLGWRDVSSTCLGLAQL